MPVTRHARAAVFGCVVTGIAACSSANPLPVGGQTSGKPTQTLASSTDGGRGGSATTLDASASRIAKETGTNVPPNCRTIEVEGSIVEELAFAGELPPPLGGTLVPGTYVLFELDFYPGDPDAGGTTGLSARKTLIVDPTNYRLSDEESKNDAGLGAPEVTSGTYSVADRVLTRNQECPAAVTIANDYSAAGSQLGIYHGAHLDVYERQTPP